MIKNMAECDRCQNQEPAKRVMRNGDTSPIYLAPDWWPKVEINGRWRHFCSFVCVAEWAEDQSGAPVS